MISIIVATYNAESYLRNCLSSIINQKDDDLELIIIDGSSKDETINIIKEYESNINFWISETDDGIYDAWNKGINICKGEWILFLGSDDELVENAIASYREVINKSRNSDIICAKLDYVDRNGNHIKYIGEPWDWNKFINSKMSFAHPGLLHKTQLFKTFGLYNINYKICGDAEFFLRTKGKLSAAFLDKVTVKMRTGGKSYSLSAIIESYKIRKFNKVMSIQRNGCRMIRAIILFFLSKMKNFFNNR